MTDRMVGVTYFGICFSDRMVSIIIVIVERYIEWNTPGDEEINIVFKKFVVIAVFSKRNCHCEVAIADEAI
jgi:hypothetical protein